MRCGGVRLPSRSQPRHHRHHHRIAVIIALVTLAARIVVGAQAAFAWRPTPRASAPATAAAALLGAHRQHHHYHHHQPRRRIPLLMMTSSAASAAAPFSSSGDHESSSSSSSSPSAPRGVKRVFAYAHGFLSDENSYKGRYFQKVLRDWGADLHLLNLNGPGGLAGITYRGALAAIDALYEAAGGAEANVRLTLFGSSLGGFIAGLYAELHPERMEKLVLFCPGFDRCARWEKVFGPEALAEWRDKGYREFDFKGQAVPVPYSFVTEAAEHPPFPAYRCPALVVHGLRDEVVPVATTTEGLLARNPHAREATQVLLVDDDHGLTKEKTLAMATHLIQEFLDIRPATSAAKPAAAAAPKPASADRIEVELKFPLDPAGRAGLEARIQAAGGELKGSVIMFDRYWDLPGEAMSLGNVWLRQRCGVWELKVPAIDGEHPNTQAVACYREICGQHGIARWLLQAFPSQLGPHAHLVDSGVEEDPLPALLKAAGAYPMAEYQTRRSKYYVRAAKGEGAGEGAELGIDIDDADYGYGIVEIEELVQRAPEIPAATDRIHRLAAAVGLEGGDSGRPEGQVIRGKLEEFIYRKDRAHHARLVAKGVFKA